MGLRVKILLFQWIFLFAFSTVNGGLVIKFDDDGSKEDTSDITHVKTQFIKNSDKRNDERYIKSDIAARGKTTAEKIKMNKKVEGFKNKILVKRILPHGYGVTSMEYDEKYKTLYKPLVRIHRKKPKVDDNDNNDENKFDLIYMVDGENTNNISNSKKDDALFKPFAIDNMDIESLPEVDTYEKDAEKYTDVNYLDWQELGNKIQKINSMSDRKDEYGNSYKFPVPLSGSQKPQEKSIYNKVKQSALGQIRTRSHGKKNTTHNKSVSKKFAAEPIKLQWFGTVGQLVSKHFTTNKDKKKRKFKKYKRDQTSRSKPDKNLIILVNNGNEKQNDIQKDIKKLVSRDLVQWYVPIGQLHSKQFNRKELLGNYERSVEDDKHKLKHVSDNQLNKYALSKTLQNLASRQTEKDIRLKDIKGMRNRSDKYRNKNRGNLSKWFGPIGGVNPKQKDVLGSVEYNPNINTNKYIFLDQINKMRVNNNKKAAEKRLIGKIKQFTEDLRSTFDRSGEDKDMKEQAKLPFWTYDETTTARSTTLMPLYPFWNYWTYEKTIHQDTCKGQTILDGGICIGTPH